MSRPTKYLIWKILQNIKDGDRAATAEEVFIAEIIASITDEEINGESS